MRRLGIAHTMYFNEKYKRSGVLFQGTFKAAKIRQNNLLYLSAYVNCNAEVHGIEQAEDWRWSSFSEYTGEEKRGLCENGKKIILGDFRSGEDYKNFAKESVQYFREKKKDEKTMLENIS